REPNTFATEPALLHAAIWHVVDAVAWDIVDHDAANVEPVPRVQRLEQVAGEDSGLEAEFGIVHLIERGIEAGEARQDRNRPERFLAIKGRGAVDVLQQAGFEHSALAPAAAQQRRP